MYHVMQRGNNREFIFAQLEYRDYLIKQMKHAVEGERLYLIHKLI
jgi:hypothetical protein